MAVEKTTTGRLQQLQRGGRLVGLIINVYCNIVVDNTSIRVQDCRYNDRIRLFCGPLGVACGNLLISTKRKQSLQGDNMSPAQNAVFQKEITLACIIYITFPLKNI